MVAEQVVKFNIYSYLHIALPAKEPSLNDANYPETDCLDIYAG